MNVQGFFTKQNAEIFDLNNNLKATEPVHLTRQGISNNDFAHSYKYKSLMIEKTVLTEGDLLLVDDEYYLTVAMRKIPFLNTNQANVLKCNCKCSLSRLIEVYDGNMLTGKENVIYKADVPCVLRATNGRMNDFDAGLIESTLHTAYIQYDPTIKLSDRITINNDEYKIDSLDNSIANVLIIRLTNDKRQEE